MAHINYLGGDMLEVGIPLQVPQQLLYIEACFLEGDRSIAIGMWEEARESMGNDKNVLRDYWKIGIQMFCQDGQVERALQAAGAFLSNTDEATDFRILMPIIKAYLDRDTDAGKQRAWALYIRLRVILGSEMNMDDYDAITSIFLTADQPDLALGAFKDMMLTGNKAAAEQDSTALYRKATGIKGGLDLVTIDRGELKWEDSHTLATLPSEFNNKYFFGKWIKKLIGEEELDAAKKVLDLMIDRGICPDAKHMNGLIGALYRTGTVRNQTLAEDIAWKMIAARIQFVQQRDLQSQLNEPLRAVKVGGKKGQKTLFLTPNATMETFSILIQQYRRRQKQDRLVDLFGTLKRAQIAPNTFFMNQLIMVDTKSHQSQWAWDTYLSLTQTHGVYPDFDTFEFLWHLMKKTADPVSKGSQKPFATCRALFAEMVKWASDLITKGKMSPELYDEIIL
jgi:pentatricopeptide repeat protein